MTPPDQTADQTRDVADAAEYRTMLGKYVDHCEPGGSIQLHENIARQIAGLLARLAEEIETLRRERDEARDYAFEATVAITGLTAGGSEYFAGKLGDRYKADLKFCVERIRESDQRSHKRLIEVTKKYRTAEAALAAAQEENARLREALEPFAKIGGYMRHTPGTRSVGVHYSAMEVDGINSRGTASLKVEDFHRAHAALSADMPAGGGEPVADAREIEWNVKSKIRLAFRKALATLPEIAPAEIASVLSSVHMQDEFFVEGKRLQMEHGTDAVAPRVEQECGAGAWSFMRKGVLAALQPAPAPDWEKAVEAGCRAVEGGYDIDGVEAILRAAAPHLGVREG